MKEIDSGNLKWGCLHTKRFWEESYKNFELNNFEYIEKLTKIIKSNKAFSENDVEQKCIACFDIEEFCGLYPGGARYLIYLA